MPRSLARSLLFCLGTAVFFVGFFCSEATGCGAAAGTKSPAPPAPAKAKKPRSPGKPVPSPTRPHLDLLPSLPSSLWHVWSDALGRTVKGEMLYLDGNYVGIKTAEGQQFRLNLLKLIPGDTEFAHKAARLLPGPQVQPATAASQIDQLVDAALTKSGLRRNPPLAEDQLVRRLYLDVAGRIPTAAELLGY